MSLDFTIHSKIRDYQVLFQNTPNFLNELKSRTNSFFVIDQTVWHLNANSILNNIEQNKLFVMPISEEKKNLDTVQELYNRLLEISAKRNLTLIAIGGGILQDVTGFTASTLYRGINWIFLPTTLLAQADSCIGSKTSLNYRNYKNLIGTFYPPSEIYIFCDFLFTQSDADFSSGLGEVIKLHLMGGKEKYSKIVDLIPSIQKRNPDILQTVVKNSLDIKMDYLIGDEFDQGRRNLLNFGHDFGHALESTSNYQLPHGLAVVSGMIAANIVSRKRGLLSNELEKEIAEKLLLKNLLIKPPLKSLNPSSIIEAMKKDKKRVGERLAIILMTDNFEFFRVNDLDNTEVSETISELVNLLFC